MKEDDAIEMRGFEVLCRALKCIYNDRPACLLHTTGSPLVIGPGGACVRFEEKED